MECIVVYMQSIKTNVVLIYRPVSYTTSVFLKELCKVLKIVQKPGISTIICGDFNENILKQESSIQNFMEQHGFTQIVDNPTTDGGTLIDHVYYSGQLKISLETKQTYYSYHNMVVLGITILKD